MKKDTKKLLIGGGVVALLAAIFWPKTAKASATVTTPGPTPGPTPPGPGSQTAPVLTPNPNAGNQYTPPAAPPASEPPSTTSQPPGAPLSALLALWEYRNGQWVEIADTHLGISDVLDQYGQVAVNLPALYSKIPQYSALKSPPYQFFRIFTSDGTKWTQIQMAGLTKNY